MRVTRAEWEDEVFGPVLDEMIAQLRDVLTPRACIHPSGPLFECDYVSQYFQSQIVIKWNYPVLQTSDEYVSYIMSPHPADQNLPRALAGAYGATTFLDRPNCIEIIPGIDPAYNMPRFSEPSHMYLPVVTSRVEPRSGFAPQDLRYNEALLHEILQRGGSFGGRGFRLTFTNAMSEVIAQLKELGRTEEIREIATAFCQVYFDLSRFEPSSSRHAEDLIPDFRRAVWADKYPEFTGTYPIYRLPLEKEEFWMSGTETVPERCLIILRYMMLRRDINAFLIGMEACTSGYQEIHEPNDSENIISMAIMTDFMDGVHAVVDAGAKWSSCLYWAIEWQSEQIVRQIVRDRPIHSFEFLGGMGGNITPIKFALQREHEGIARALLEENPEMLGIEDLLTIFQPGVSQLTNTLLSLIRREMTAGSRLWLTLRESFSHAVSHAVGMKREPENRSAMVAPMLAVVNATKQVVLLYGTLWADAKYVRLSLEAGADPNLVFQVASPVHITSNHRITFELLASHNIDPLVSVHSAGNPPLPFIHHCVRLGCSVQLIRGRFAPPDRHVDAESSSAADLGRPELPRGGPEPFRLEGSEQRRAKELAGSVRTYQSSLNRRHSLPIDWTVGSAAEPPRLAGPAGTGDTSAGSSVALRPAPRNEDLPDQSLREDNEPISDGFLECKGFTFPKNLLYSRCRVWFGSDAVPPAEMAPFVATWLRISSETVIRRGPHLAAWASVTGRGLFFIGNAFQAVVLLADAVDPVLEGFSKFHLSCWGCKFTFKAPDTETRAKWVSALQSRITEAKSRADIVMRSHIYRRTLADGRLSFATAEEIRVMAKEAATRAWLRPEEEGPGLTPRSFA